jgi:SRSO17 transposase
MVAMKAAAVQGPALMEGRDLTSLVSSLDRFLDPYRALMARGEQRKHLGVLVSGLLSDLERKSVEPIAVRSGLPRRPLQRFVGAGRWDDRLVREMIRTEAADEIGDPGGALVVDNSGFHKQGNESVGVERQWCGRLGKVDNCQVGYFLVYSTPKGDALVDAQLYLPKSWADDAARRELTAVPRERRFLKGWELADELIAAASPHLPHAWILGDDEFGRPSAFRDRLAARGERYLLDVPSNLRVRKPAHWPGRSARWKTLTQRRRTQPPGKWKRVRLRDGEKGPIDVEAFVTRVETTRKGAPPRIETLLVMRNLNHTQTWYLLANGDAPLDVEVLVSAASQRHHVEQIFGAGKGEVGLDHYEVRSWVGWHHHMTLSMLALWYLVRQRRRLGKKLRN